MVIGQRDTAGPTIAALVEWAEELRAREVARTFGAGERDRRGDARSGSRC